VQDILCRCGWPELLLPSQLATISTQADFTILIFPIFCPYEYIRTALRISFADIAIGTKHGIFVMQTLFLKAQVAQGAHSIYACGEF